MLKKIKQKIVEVNVDLKIDERSGEIYAVAALFETPDSIFHAAEKVGKSKYSKYDIHTPYPIHGMDDAMRLKPTKLGFVTFIFGLLGVIIALLMIGYMSGIDYRNIIGGKPFFALPPSMPVAFELTVLFAALLTIIFTLFVFNKLPKIFHPLMDTEYMKRVSTDRYGIVIEAEDKNFDKDKVTEFLKSLGSSEISLIYKFTKDEDKIKTPIFDLKFIGLLAGVAVITAIGTYIILNKVIYTTPFDWMTDQFRVNAQTQSKFFEDGFGMRLPVEGTVSKGSSQYKFKGMPDSLVKNLSNPLPVTKEVFARGKQKYETFCSSCHGYYGKGDSRLKGQYPNPPTLHSEKIKNFKDGNIYHIIVNGQNVMPSYSKQISPDDRWAIVHYIRALLRSQNALDNDFPPGNERPGEENKNK
ncbi:MAG: DUF3341 domain-containing protein [Ignavibacteria bacterium]|nr:DUF3341 domain-containing protein [Ignavibacteria bacterium]